MNVLKVYDTAGNTRFEFNHDYSYLSVCAIERARISYLFLKAIRQLANPDEIETYVPPEGDECSQDSDCTRVSISNPEGEVLLYYDDSVPANITCTIEVEYIAQLMQNAHRYFWPQNDLSQVDVLRNKKSIQRRIDTENKDWDVAGKNEFDDIVAWDELSEQHPLAATHVHEYVRGRSESEIIKVINHSDNLVRWYLRTTPLDEKNENHENPHPFLSESQVEIAATDKQYLADYPIEQKIRSEWQLGFAEGMHSALRWTRGEGWNDPY